MAQKIFDLPRYKDLGKKPLPKILICTATWLDPDRKENKWLHTGEPFYGADSEWQEVEIWEPSSDDPRKKVKTTGFWNEKRQDFIRSARNPDRVMEVIASMGTRDRDREIIEVAGWTTRNFFEYPAITWAHRTDQLLIGNGIRLQKQVKNNQLKFWPEFTPAHLNDWAEKVFQNYREAWTRAWSVHFDPFKYITGDYEAVMNGDEDAFLMKYTKQDLVEIAACGLGAHPQALTVAEKAYGSDFKKRLFPGFDEQELTSGRLIKGEIIDDPPGDYKWYKWDKSEAAKWCKDNDYKPKALRKDTNFWHFSLTPKERYSEFKTKWLGSKRKPPDFDTSDPSGRPVLLGLGKLKGKQEWEEHNLEFYHGEEELKSVSVDDETIREISAIVTLASIDTKLNAVLTYMGSDIIPRLDRLEKRISGGETEPDTGRTSPKPETSKEGAGSQKMDQVKAVQKAAESLFRTAPLRDGKTAVFSFGMPRKKKGGENK